MSIAKIVEISTGVDFLLCIKANLVHASCILMKARTDLVKVYGDHGTLTAEIRRFERAGLVEVVTFPYDPDSRSKSKTPGLAMPSAAEWQHLQQVSWEELGKTTLRWSDFGPSTYLQNILDVVGAENREDALHIDSAYKSECKAFITSDKKHILVYAQQLETLLGIRFFHHIDDADELRRFVGAEPTQLV